MTFCKVRDVKTPHRGTKFSAGIDFYVPNDFKKQSLYPGEDILIPSGIKVKIPHGYALIAYNKSSIATTAGTMHRYNYKNRPNVSNNSLIIGAAVIDEDYQGEIHIHLINSGIFTATIHPGVKIAQFILIPVNYAELLEVPESELHKDTTDRGEGGFGSTGTL